MRCVDDFYYLDGQLGVVRTGRDGAHGAEFVHAHELELAICRALTARPLREEAVILALRDEIGISTGAASRAATSAAIARLRATGIVAEGPLGLTRRGTPAA